MNRFHAMSRQYAVKDANGNGRVEWKDSLKSGFPSVKFVGASYQAAEPTPDAPQDVLGNNATVRATGVNLWGGDAMCQDFVDIAGADATLFPGKVFYRPASVSGKRFCKGLFKPNTQYTFFMRAHNGSASYRTVTNLRFEYSDGTRSHIYLGNEADADEYRRCVAVSAEGKTLLSIIGTDYAGNVFLDYMNSGLFEGVLSANDFKPYHNGGEATAPTLYAIGDIRDEWDAQTGKGIRRVVKTVLTGTERFSGGKLENGVAYFHAYTTPGDRLSGSQLTIATTHFSARFQSVASQHPDGGVYWVSNTNEAYRIVVGSTLTSQGVVDVASWRAWLAEQYSAGTPVTVFWAAKDIPFETEPMPLTCTTGYGQIVQVGGDISDVPIGVRYLTHGKRKPTIDTLGTAVLGTMKLGG